MQVLAPVYGLASAADEARALEPIRVPLREGPFQFDEGQMEVYRQKGETETFRLIGWDDFTAESVTLPIDKIVADIVRDGF